jgi:hypothetical protein
MNDSIHHRRFLWIAPILLALSRSTVADGLNITQIYAPYVQILEQEIELVAIADSQSQNQNQNQEPSYNWQKIGYGRSLLPSLYSELSLTRVDDGHRTDTMLELENIWQLTEQGEYASDWGLLLELETFLDKSAREVSLGILNNWDIGKFSLLTNASIMYESGEDIRDEWETLLAIQGRYRRGQAWEPTVEVFVGQDTLAVGPGLTGVIKGAGARQLRWNMVVLNDFDTRSDLVLKLEIEYEFF